MTTIADLEARIAVLEAQIALPAQLLDRTSTLLGRRDLSLSEQQDWMAGSATGGPDGDGRYPLTDSTGFKRKALSPAGVAALLERGLGASMRTPQQHMGPLASISNAQRAADGTWSGTDATPAIQAAIDWCASRGGGTVFIPRGQYFIGSPGYFEPGNTTRRRGVIKMRRNVKITSDGALLAMSGGRHNPPSMFLHAYWEDADIDNVRVEGLTIDCNMAGQTWDIGEASGGTGDTDFQFQHGIEWLDGDNIEITRCVIRNTRGSGIAAGNPFQLTGTDVDTAKNLHISRCEFYNCYREGAFICWAYGGSLSHCYIHGDGYLVAGVDLERHYEAERVEAFQVHDNLFDFRDGWGPIERRKQVRMRRAVSMGFFYNGYPGNANDGRFGRLIVHDNVIYQGQIDAWGVSDAVIAQNHFTIDAEDFVVYGPDGQPLQEYGADMVVKYVSGEAIRCTNYAATAGLVGPAVIDNTVVSSARTWGIWVSTHAGATVSRNKVRGTLKPGIRFEYSAGIVSDNDIEDVGRRNARCAAIDIASNFDMVLVDNNRAVDTRPFEDANGIDQRGMTYAVEISSALNFPAKITGNAGRNLTVPGESFKPFPGQEDAVLAFANTNGSTSSRHYGTFIVGSGKGLANLKIDGATNDDKSIHFMNDGVVRTQAGLFGAGGQFFSIFYFTEAGAFGGNFFKCDRATGGVQANAGRFEVAGTWNKPMVFAGAVRMWADPATGIFYRSYTDPNGPTDGTPMDGTALS